MKIYAFFLPAAVSIGVGQLDGNAQMIPETKF